MTNICGHDRKTLQWALRFKNTSGVTCGGGAVPPDAMQNALVDVSDPAKLAAIIAELLRERGIDAEGLWICAHSNARIKIYWSRHCARLAMYIDKRRTCGGDLDIPKARKLALALFNARPTCNECGAVATRGDKSNGQFCDDHAPVCAGELPNASAQDIERMIGAL